LQHVRRDAARRASLSAAAADSCKIDHHSAKLRQKYADTCLTTIDLDQWPCFFAPTLAIFVLYKNVNVDS